MEFSYIKHISFTSESNAEPVTLADLKNYLKIRPDITADDVLLTSLITIARRKIEDFLRISLISRTITLIANIIDDYYDLPYGPLKNLTTFTNNDGTELTADSDYKIIGNAVNLLYAQSNPVTIVYTTDGDSNPIFVMGMKQQIAYMYENRGDSKLDPLLNVGLRAYRRVV